MPDTRATKRPFRTRHVVNAGSGEYLALEIDTLLPGERVTRVLEAIAGKRRPLAMTRVDDGPDFAGKALDARACMLRRRAGLHRP